MKELRSRANPAARRNKSAAAGFSLLELVLAMLVLSLLVGMVFMTASTSLALGAGVVRKQNEEMLKSAFFDLLNRHFASIPGNAVFDLKAQDSGSHFTSDMTFQKVPLAFTWGGTEQVAAALQLSTVRRRDGLELVKNTEPGSLWPYGIKDAKGNVGWFEENMIIFWGANDESGMLKTLSQEGYSVEYLG